ncbi:hypothetical protein FGO68_gene8909 [Halteria grandinella]|uniref:Fibronectin type-III domain-containing protein n=1 Tax=Halteria grandinella TaxID=5974 RepID=A0A8J8NXR4_HALGN|nr:hypothetical protein FGO68_gene8909 [Halteria grandinella]
MDDYDPQFTTFENQHEVNSKFTSQIDIFEQILESLSKYHHICQLCLEVQASSQCQDCKGDITLYCNECFEHQHSRGIMKSHAPRTLQEDEFEFCALHQNIDYCLTCKLIICNECEQHPIEHDLCNKCDDFGQIEIREKTDKIREEIKKCQIVLIQIKNEQASEVADIDQEFEIYIREIKNLKQKEFETVERKYFEEIKLVKDQLGSLSKTLRLANQLEHLIKRNSGLGSIKNYIPDYSTDHKFQPLKKSKEGIQQMVHSLIQQKLYVLQSTEESQKPIIQLDESIEGGQSNTILQENDQTSQEIEGLLKLEMNKYERQSIIQKSPNMPSEDHMTLKNLALGIDDGKSRQNSRQFMGQTTQNYSLKSLIIQPTSIKRTINQNAQNLQVIQDVKAQPTMQLRRNSSKSPISQQISNPAMIQPLLTSRATSNNQLKGRQFQFSNYSSVGNLQNLKGNSENQNKENGGCGGAQTSRKRDQSSNNMSSTRRLQLQQTQAEREAEEQLRQMKQMTEQLNANPMIKRRFTQISATSNAVQVVWGHPDEFTNIDKRALSYELQYGVGIKVSKVEQFKKIYGGRAHKCIITDLQPKTNYRFRVVAISQSQSEFIKGEWSDPMSVMTKEPQCFDQSSFGNCAQFIVKNYTGQNPQTEKFINFLQAGTITGAFGYSFGEHLWAISVRFEESVNLSNMEQSGIMLIGVVNKRSNKVIGSVINYTLTGGEIKVRVFIDTGKRTLTVYSSIRPEGEVFSDLPKDGIYFPAIQNKNMKFNVAGAKLLVSCNFDLKVPTDRSQLSFKQQAETSEISNQLSNLSKYFPPSEL